MRKVVVKAFFLLLPIAILASVVVFVDPFEYFNWFHAVSAEQKLKTSAKLNYTLWKLIHYRREPEPNILLGDSRMNHLSVQSIEELTGKRYANLAYGSGTLDEVCATFWEAASVSRLERVYIGLNLNLYNAYNSRDRVSASRAVIADPLAYLINRDVLKATLLLIEADWLSRRGHADKVQDLERPAMTVSEFWDYQLNVTTSRYYSNYARPVQRYEELCRISRYCAEHGIELTFLILPTHEDLRSKVRSFGLEEAEARFRSDLRELGTVYDFDYSNNMTDRRDNFKDPYHLTDAMASELVREIWGPEARYAKIYTHK